MMTSDRDYFAMRAEEEEARAADSEGLAREAHESLAAHYRECADNSGPRAIPDRPLRFVKLTIV